MQREVWVKEEIGQLLLAVTDASRSATAVVAGSGADAPLVSAYDAGFQAAVTSLALAFGLLDLAASLPMALTPTLARGNAVRATASVATKGVRVWIEEDWR